MASRPEGSIAVNPEVTRFVNTRRAMVDVGNTDFTDVSAVVVAAHDLNNGVVSRLRATGFRPAAVRRRGPRGRVLISTCTGSPACWRVTIRTRSSSAIWSRPLRPKYDDDALPPFFGALARYERRGYSAFDCPGHQGGQFFMRHPAGRRFVDFFGHNLFRADLCNADVTMGDLLIHEGAPAPPRHTPPRSSTATRRTSCSTAPPLPTRWRSARC